MPLDAATQSKNRDRFLFDLAPGWAESCVAMGAILKLPRATTYMRLVSICLLLCPFIDNLLGRTAHYVAADADHDDVEQ